MKLTLTLVSTNENKSIMDVLAQLATEAMERKQAENVSASPYSGGLKKLLIKGAAKTVEFIGEDAVNSVYSMLKPALAKIINDNLQQNRIPASFLVEQIKKDQEKMKVTLTLDSINYKGMINRFLPDILESAREHDPDNYVWRVYDVISDDQPKIVKVVMDTISNEKKDEIIELMILQYKNNLCDIISSLLVVENIELAVDDISI